jgi:hypothetical protein
MNTAYYVAVNGSDDHRGTVDAPFRSLQRAQQEVRNQIENGMHQNVMVYVRGGFYELESTLRFNDKDSGRDGFEVRYCSFPGEEAVLAGGKRITNWTPFQGSIWRANVDKGISFYTLYADNARVKQARLPAAGYFKTDDHPTSSENHSM